MRGSQLSSGYFHKIVGKMCVSGVSRRDGGVVLDVSVVRCDINSKTLGIATTVACSREKTYRE